MTLTTELTSYSAFKINLFELTPWLDHELAIKGLQLGSIVVIGQLSMTMLSLMRLNVAVVTWQI